MAGWQDDPIAGAAGAPPPGAPAPLGGAAPAGGPQPAWMADPVAPQELTQGDGSQVAAQPMTGYRRVQGDVEAAARGATFGLADKFAAVMDSLSNEVSPGFAQHVLGVSPGESGMSFGDLYHSRLAGYRQRADEYAAGRPIEAGAAYGAGMLGAIPLMPGLSAATLPGKIAQGAAVGAGIGAGAGFAGTDDTSVAGDLAGTGAGAAAGAVTGGALTGVGEVVAKPVVDWFARKFGGDAAVQSQALKMIAGRIKQDSSAGGPTAQDMLDALNEGARLGKPLAPVDVGGANVQALGGKLARAPGESRQTAADFLNTRDQGAGTRLSTDVNTGISGGGSVFDTAQALDQARSTAAKPLYDQAYAANQSMQSPEIDRVLQTPAGRAALRQAAVKMQNDMTLVGRPDPELTAAAKEAADLGLMEPHGTGIGVASGLKLRTLDYVKRALDDQIGSAIKAGERDNARILIGLKNKLVSSVDDADVTGISGPNSRLAAGGKYAQARAAYSGPSQSMDALDRGSSFMTKSPSEIAHDVSTMAPGDIEFYKLGAADALRTSIAKTGAAGDEARKLVGNDYIKQQLRPLFASEADYTRFIDSATAESQMFATRHVTLGNSATAGRVAEDAGGHGGGVLGNIATGVGSFAAGEPIYGITKTAQGVTQLLRNLGENSSPKVNAAAAQTLFNSSQPRNASNLARVLEMAQRKRLPPFISMPAEVGAGQHVPALARAYLGPGQGQ